MDSLLIIAVWTPDIGLSQMEITWIYADKIVIKQAQMWNYDTIGGDNFCYKSPQQIKSITPMYDNKPHVEADRIPQP
jgi:hypothetical protein